MSRGELTIQDPHVSSALVNTVGIAFKQQAHISEGLIVLVPPVQYEFISACLNICYQLGRAMIQYVARYIT